MALQTLEKPVADSRFQKSRLFGRSADSSAQVQPVTNTARVKQAELVLFATQLSVMLDSGVVLSDAIEAIGQQMRPGTFQNVIEDIAGQIKNGDTFSSALMGYPKIFNTMFVSMVRASEVSGRMSEMLDVLSGYLSAEAETRKQVKSAMIYPLVMLLMAVAATGSLMFFVLPRFTKIYQSRGAALPKLTQLLVNCSSLLANPLFLAFSVTLCFAGYWAFSIWKQTDNGCKAIDWLKLHTPIFSTMIVDAVMTRSMRILSTMVNTGVPLLDALDVMKSASDNYYFQRLWIHTDAKIRDGYQFSDAVMTSQDSHLIDPGILQMIRAGEKSGQIGQVCDKISIFLGKKLENSIRVATSLIEPLMITLMGGVIGTIAIALLMPVFKISSVMTQ
ncbi:MAG: type II secretion system F family protein [Planctomycetes bacterium]|nr:type II secretion system F family protein [Planctomycetota bacterium]